MTANAHRQYKGAAEFGDLLVNCSSAASGHRSSLASPISVQPPTIRRCKTNPRLPRVIAWQLGALSAISKTGSGPYGRAPASEVAVTRKIFFPLRAFVTQNQNQTQKKFC